jgi:hypothetical protein
MTQLIISNVTGITSPYEIYVCNVYGNSCVLVATVNTPIPPQVEITLSAPFDTAPAIGVKIVNPYCEKFVLLYCTDIPPKGKQFQDGDFFFFMDYDIYQFQ